MTNLLAPNPTGAIVYPESDGNPISDHTLQFSWITLFKDNLEAIYANNPDVFVAGDLLWYPVEGNNRTRVAPDVMVVFGCPKGQRGSFREWIEGVTPQVVIEILSPGNRTGEMLNKLLFCDRFGVEEYYLYDPFKFEFVAFVRDSATGTLEEQGVECGFVSPRLGIRFVPNLEAPLEVFGPNGSPFLTFVQLEQRVTSAEQRAGSAEQRARALAAMLRELGIDPDAV